uniref:Uncharacterized protein n=1 Tax=Panagrolaimus davidi TaxID=227884 RepID=A0A914P1R1_9BILA
MSSNDLLKTDKEFFGEMEKLDFQEKQLKLDEKIIYDQDFINPQKNIKERLNFAEKEISDQDFIDPLETLDVLQRLNLAENEIFRLKAELKIKEDLIENLLQPIYAKILKKEKQGENLSELLSNINEHISKALNRSIENPSFSPSNVNQFQWHGKHHAMLIMKFDSRLTAIRVQKAATKIQKSAECYRTIVIRQDYSTSELKLLSLLWNEVNERNKKEGMFAWTVKSFRIVKSDHPGPLINKPFNENF